MREFHQGQGFKAPHKKAGYMEAALLYYGQLCLAIRGGPYMTPNAAFELFDNFQKSLEKEGFDLAGEKVKITTSIGVCTEVSGNVDAMIKTTDQLLYQAKEGGRNCVILS